MKSYKIYSVIFFLVGCAGAWWFLNSGFDQIQSLRQLERVPKASAGAVLPGEVNISGVAKKYKRVVASAHTRTDSLYYRYKHEVEKTDSDGDKTWSTVKDIRDGVDFWLTDESGRIRVLVEKNVKNIDWNVASSYVRREGRNRYTEWRIEPGQNVYAFAKARHDGNKLVIDFSAEGFYTPIISNGSQKQVQSSMGIGGLLRLSVGLVFCALAVFGFVSFFGIHRVLSFLSILTFTLSIVLVHLSLKMMSEDIKNGLLRYQNQIEAANIELFILAAEEDLPQQDFAYPNTLNVNSLTYLDDKNAFKVKEYRLTLLVGLARLIEQMESVPERWLLPLWGIQLLGRPENIDGSEWGEALRRSEAFPETQIDPTWSYIALGIGGLLFIISSFLGYRQIKFKRLIENIPVSQSIAVGCGLSEVKGRLVLGENASPLLSPYTNSPCAWYYYKKEIKTGSGKDAKWHTIEEKTNFLHFFCRDEEGEIKVRPRDADVMTKHRITKQSGSLRYTERTLKIDDPMYIIGVAEIDPQRSDRVVIKSGDFHEPFIVSNYSERDVMLSKSRVGMGFFLAAFSGLLVALIMTFGRAGGFAATDFLLSALAAPVYLLVLMLIVHFNDLIFLKNRTSRNWSYIDVALRKRKNIVENMSSITKRYMEHEKSLLTLIVKLRQDYSVAKQGADNAGNFFETEKMTTQKFQTVIEQYPDLKANSLVKRLMSMITRQENEIAFYRKGYNDAVELYNTRIASFPDVLFARMFGFSRKSFLQK